MMMVHRFGDKVCDAAFTGLYVLPREVLYQIFSLLTALECDAPTNHNGTLDADLFGDMFIP